MNYLRVRWSRQITFLKNILIKLHICLFSRYLNEKILRTDLIYYTLNNVSMLLIEKKVKYKVSFIFYTTFTWVKCFTLTLISPTTFPHCLTCTILNCRRSFLTLTFRSLTLLLKIFLLSIHGRGLFATRGTSLVQNKVFLLF